MSDLKEPGSAATEGWPFLVAAGRRRDFTVVVAPDFLVGSREYGLLLDLVKPGAANEPPRVMTTPVRDGPLFIAYRTHLLTPQDLVAGGSGPVGPLSSARDEHNRPLRLVIGFVSPHQLSTDAVDDHLDTDLDACQQPVLAAYRQFLEDEDAFSVVQSTPLALRTPLARRPAATTPRAAPPAPSSRTAVTLGLLAVAVVALLVLFFAFRASRTPTPCPSTTTSSGVEGVNRGAPSATCPPSATDG